MKLRRPVVYLIAATAAVLILSTPSASQAEEPATVPEDIRLISEELGARYNICPELIQAICYVESRFQPEAENGGCVGVMQVSERWHKDRMKKLGVMNLRDPRGNMVVAVDYLAELFRKYEEAGVVLMVYNGDSGAEDVLAGLGDISEYAKTVLKLSEELERKAGK